MIGRPHTRKPHKLSSLAYVNEIIEFSRLPAYENQIVLQQNYLEKGLSAKEISVLLGCGTTKIKKELRRFEIKKTGVEIRHKKNLKYGQKIVSGKIQNHKQELNTQKAIIKMHTKEGLSASAIARVLTEMKVPTKKQGKKWDHSVVIDILKRENVYQSKRQPKGKK